MKGLVFSLAAIFLLGFTSCNKDDDDAPLLGAKIFVTVENALGSPEAGKTVYLFKDEEITNDTPIADAKKQVITNEDGIAEFSLNLTELNIFESQTSLYFGVFYTVADKNYVAGSTAITVKRGDSKKLDIKIPL